MQKEELDAIQARDTGPIERHVAALGFDAALPVVALGVCAARIDEAEPALLAVLWKAARGDLLASAEELLFFRGLHILGGARRPLAFAPLMQFLRRPFSEVDSLIGDATTMTLPRIVAGVFDGDATSLFAAIEDPELDEFVRGALLDSATFLTWDKQIDRTLMADFLQRFYESHRAPPRDHIWNKWAESIALLGERELADKVREAFRTQLVDPSYMRVKHFEEMLADADRSTDSAERFEREHLGYLEDIQVTLEQFTSGYDEVPDEAESNSTFAWPEFPAKPHVNPLRHVGRNDPCPCGSGKKFKKCCLT